MKKIIFAILLGFLCCGIAPAQEAKKSELQQQAEDNLQQGHPIGSRALYVRAYEDYFSRKQWSQGIECVQQAVDLYIQGSQYQEPFDLLRNVEQAVYTQIDSPEEKATVFYQISKIRMKLYMGFKKPQAVMEQLNNMERHAVNSKDADLQNDALYNKAIFYYTFGQNEKGNAVFREMAAKLTTSKEYDKVDKVYQTLIANCRKSGNANLVAQSYSNYVLWKDSVNVLKFTDSIAALRNQIAENEAAIDERDSSLTTRKVIIAGLGILAAALAAALVLGGIVLMRFILQTRKQRKTIKLANENNALKAKFISNISAQLEPTLRKLDSRQPEVRALLDFSRHIQTLSALENAGADAVELEEIQIPQFCEALMNGIRDKARKGVTLKVDAPRMSAQINKEYVSHILTHLLTNAAEYTPEGGHIWLDYKKRGAHSHQFIVSDTGCGIPEDKHEDIFKPFLEIRDLTKGDGLGLPICKQMALRMNGDLEIDPSFTKGTRFVLNLHA